MIAYLIKSGLCLALLLAFYYWVLEREKMHQFNRFYLLGSILFSFIVPFAVIYVEAAPVLVEEAAAAITQKNQPFITQGTADETSLGWSHYLFIVYTFVSLLMLTRFVKSLGDILLKIKRNEIVPYQKAKIVLVNDRILPHTFWNYIFINKEDFQKENIEKELFTHELTHVTQKHTVDVLIVEALQVVLWFNPFFYPLKKAIQLNHEFLADDKVIASHNDIPKYQYLLLDKAAWKNKYYLASNLNYSLTKKRLLMMKTPNSKSTLLWKKLAIVPLMGGLIFLFADRVEAQTKKKKPEVIEIVETSKGASKRQMELYQNFIKTSKKTKKYKMEDVILMRKIYRQMTEKQKKSVTNLNDLVPPPPSRSKLLDAVEPIDTPPAPPPPPPHENATEKEKERYQKVLTEYEKKIQAKRAKEKKKELARLEQERQRITEISEERKKKLKEREKKKFQEKKEVEKKRIELIKKERELYERRKQQQKKIKEEKILIEKKKALKKKTKKGDWDTFEERISNPRKETKVIEVIEEEKEIPTLIEIKEVPEGIEEEEIEIIEKLEQEEEIEIVEKLEQDKDLEKELKKLYKDLVKNKAIFYLDGKKVSAKKVKKYFHSKSDKVENIDITKGKTEIVKLTLKK
jgi:beta-lactamase regulating signal transducer with metallopeptidase domain